MSARHRQQKKRIAELKQHVEHIETFRAAYAIVIADTPENESVLLVMLATRKLELDAALGCTHSELSHAKVTLAEMPKCKEVA